MVSASDKLLGHNVRFCGYAKVALWRLGLNRYHARDMWLPLENRHTPSSLVGSLTRSVLGKSIGESAKENLTRRVIEAVEEQLRDVGNRIEWNVIGTPCLNQSEPKLESPHPS